MEDTLEIIICPACGKEMTKVFCPDSGVNVDVCVDGCGGIFFDGRELKKFDEQNENIDDIKQALKGRTFTKTDETKTRICPLCGNNMVKNNVSIKKEITIDECYNCGAKFFDNGELTKMREQYATEEDRRQDLLAKTYEQVGAQIELMGLQNELNHAKRSKFLKLLDSFLLK